MEREKERKKERNERKERKERKKRKKRKKLAMSSGGFIFTLIRWVVVVKALGRSLDWAHSHVNARHGPYRQGVKGGNGTEGAPFPVKEF